MRCLWVLSRHVLQVSDVLCNGIKDRRKALKQVMFLAEMGHFRFWNRNGNQNQNQNQLVSWTVGLEPESGKVVALNPDSWILALNLNPAPKSLNPDSDSHIPGLHLVSDYSFIKWHMSKITLSFSKCQFSPVRPTLVMKNLILTWPPWDLREMTKFTHYMIAVVAMCSGMGAKKIKFLVP